MTQQYRIGKHATTVATIERETVVTYHSTAVVRFDSERIILDSGGWRTATTKTRMNQASNQFGLGVCVYQHNWEWFVSYQGKTLEYFDGMEIQR